MGIVGESGSGKSVTALSVLGLLPPSGNVGGGEIIFHKKDGSDIDLATAEKRELQRVRGSEIGMVFQEPMSSLNPVFSCGEQVAEAILSNQKTNKAAAKKQVLNLFEKVKLKDPARIYSAYPHQLSGGQRQRVMIAMAISNNPSLLIADEPTSALDVTVQKSILQLMKELKKEWGGATIFISHDLGVIAEIADRVLVMKAGKIVEEGSVEAIFKQPKHAYTRELLGDFSLQSSVSSPQSSRQSSVHSPQSGLQSSIGSPQSGLQSSIGSPQSSRQSSIGSPQSSRQSSIGSRQTTAEKLENGDVGQKKKEAVLVVKNLRAWFPKKKNFFGKILTHVKAVDDVSFEIFAGETLGIVGESGSGKSTLAKTILHLHLPGGGEIIYDGKKLNELPEKKWKNLRKDLQVIFQDPYASLNPRMMIGPAIMEPMKVHGIGQNDGERKGRAFELLETVGLEAAHFWRFPNEFSGGQRQRICIARALALEPRFVICDECVSALDVTVQRKVLDLLKKLQKERNLTYIFISHDLSVVRQISDRTLVMKDGKIVEIGETEEIYRHPKEAYTRGLLEAVPKMF